MVEVRWNKEALADINEIASYISTDSVVYARIQTEKFFDRVQILKTNIRSGRVVPEMNIEIIKELIEGNYRIIYQIVKTNRVEILCVLHSKRLIENHPTFK